jgi:hypothetical protein
MTRNGCRDVRIREVISEVNLGAAVLYSEIDVASSGAATALADALTPTASFAYNGVLAPIGAMVGTVIQVMAIAFLISAISGRVQKVELFPAVASGD